MKGDAETARMIPWLIRFIGGAVVVNSPSANRVRTSVTLAFAAARWRSVPSPALALERSSA